LKTVTISGNKLSFYDVDEPVGESAAKYTIELPETDLSDINKTLATLQGDESTEGSIKAISKAAADSKDEAIAAAQKSADDAASALEDEKDATKDGSLAKQIADVADSVDGLADIAKSGSAKDVTIEDTADKITAGTVEGALAEIVGKVDANASDIADIQDEIGSKASGEDSATGLYKEIADAQATVEAEIGNLETLETTSKSDVVGAINEVKASVTNASSAGVVTVTTASTPTDGYLKTYVISQGESEIGKIDIPRDLVVREGSVVVNPEGQEEGTYIKLVIANQDEPIYINVKSLVDVYTASANATQVQIAVSDTNEISATLVADSVTSTELADNAVVTSKIADGNVTTDKLSEAIKTSLGKADTALQSSDLTDINKDIADIKESLGEGGSVESQITTAIEGLDATVSQEAGDDGLAIEVVEEDGKLKSVTASIAAETYDAYGSASTVQDNLDDFVDSITFATDAQIAQLWSADTTTEENA
jgi:hypothetical protein